MIFLSCVAVFFFVVFYGLRHRGETPPQWLGNLFGIALLIGIISLVVFLVTSLTSRLSRPEMDPHPKDTIANSLRAAQTRRIMARVAGVIFLSCVAVFFFVVFYASKHRSEPRPQWLVKLFGIAVVMGIISLVVFLVTSLTSRVSNRE